MHPVSSASAVPAVGAGGPDSAHGTVADPVAPTVLDAADPGTPSEPTAWPGTPFPLGVTWDGAGVNVAVWSSTAAAVWMCLFDADGREFRVRLAQRTFNVWHGYLPEVAPGQRYGLRVDGPHDPHRGLFHCPATVLVDPYARAIEGDLADDASLGSADSADSADSAGATVRSIVVHDDFDWGADRRPGTPWDETVIYELHVRGFTRLMPGVPEDLRGTYAGLGHPAAVDYLRSLGITTVELMPIHQFVTEPAIRARGLGNYWGYNSLGFFAAHAPYAAHRGPGPGGTDTMREFKAMVRSLHAAGLEVILDVVYNHTAEGAPDGPLLSWRGLDNQGYYRTAADDPSRYVDYTGCGNTMDLRHPFALRMVMDSLRYWVSEMHVDGFRFDLASALARSEHGVDRVSAFFQTIHQDPVISQVKLIAEPWDVGDGGYQVGAFPAPWSEWNGRYRDAVRDFWADGDGGVRELACRLSGSSDLYSKDGRPPQASVNFVTSHDGFTLRDLVSYQRKHNGANGENGRDGSDDNRSDNCGVEGETDDPAIVELRLRQARNLLTTLLLSTGVPMLTAGDERWRTQRGNNNAFVQDNDMSWIDWEPGDAAADLTGLVQQLLALRRRSPVLRQRAFFQGHPVPGGDGCKDLAWFGRDGRELHDRDWFDRSVRTVGMYLDGRGLRHRGPRNEIIVDDSYLLVLHAGADGIEFVLPGAPWAHGYETVIDTAQPSGRASSTTVLPAGPVTLPARSCLLLRVHRT